MVAQTRAAIEDADASIFVIDARAGVTPVDAHFATLLRESGKPVILAANKAEGRAGESGFLDAYALGIGEPIAISAEHGEGMGDLRDALAGDRSGHPTRKTRKPEKPREAGPDCGGRAAERRQVDARSIA